MVNKVTKMATDEELDNFLLKELGDRVSDLSLVPTAGQPSDTLALNWPSARTYYEQHCRKGNDCPNHEYALDCTHFVCHGLASGGVKLENPTATCDSGFGIRVADLAAAFKNATNRYSNVIRVNNFSETKSGDFCFVVSWFGLSKDHAMVAADRVTHKDGKVWGHTYSRCGEKATWEGETLVIYRIK